eukprot:3849827-Pyramimonas_sp.AAC.2
MAEAVSTSFDGPIWKGPPEEYNADKILHPPTEEQQAKGWEQNWDAYTIHYNKTDARVHGLPTTAGVHEAVQVRSSASKQLKMLVPEARQK